MAHIHEKIDFTVAVYIVNVRSNKVLLVLHRQLNRWLPVGGHIELHETPDEAADREIQEECGLPVRFLNEPQSPHWKGTKLLRQPYHTDVHPISDTHRHIGMIYYASTWAQDVMLADREHHDIRWVDQEELMDLKPVLLESTLFYAREAIRTVRNTLVRTR